MKICDYCTGIQHVGLPTADMEGTLSFYSKIGFKPVFSTINDGRRVSFLRLGNLVVEAYESDNCPGKTGAIDHIALDVENIDEVFALVRKENLQTEDKVVNYLPFFENGVRFITIIGPNSERIEFNHMC